MRCQLVVPATLSAALWAYACGDGATEPTTPPTPPPDLPRATTVTVTPATAELSAIGATVQLAARVLDQNGQAMAGTAVTWSSSATSVTTVSGSGLVTAVADGTATITATSSGVTGGAELTVVAPVPTAVAVTPDTVAFTAIVQTVQLAAEVRDQAGRAMEDVAVSWSSADTMVAMVDSAGVVTAVDNGADIPGKSTLIPTEMHESTLAKSANAEIPWGGRAAGTRDADRGRPEPDARSAAGGREQDSPSLIAS